MNDLKSLAQRLGFNALVADWDKYEHEPWVEPLLVAEEKERTQRSLERRIKEAKLGKFKLIADFDWKWPKHVDREQIEELFTLQFIQDASNVVLFGANGLGKTMIAQNLAYQALLGGFNAKFVTASEMLNDLAAQDGATALQRCLRKYSSPAVLVIDEVGYLSYGNEYADLLYEVFNRRYQQRSTILTTNRVFKEWSDVFPGAACVGTLVDRLVHRSEIVKLEGESYRLREAKERTEAKAQRRKRDSRRDD